MHKIFERRAKELWKMSLGDIHIMIFYGRPENINLTHSIKFITITLLSIVSVNQQEKKQLSLPNVSEISERRLKIVLIAS